MSDSTKIPAFIGLIEYIVSQAFRMTQTSDTGHVAFGHRSYSTSPYTGNIVHQVNLKGQIATQSTSDWFEVECNINVNRDEIMADQNDKIKFKIGDIMYNIYLKKGSNVLGYPNVEKVVPFQ